MSPPAETSASARFEGTPMEDGSWPTAARSGLSQTTAKENPAAGDAKKRSSAYRQEEERMRGKR